MTRLTTTALAACALGTLAFAAGCADNALIQREARSLESAPMRPSAVRGHAIIAPRSTTVAVVSRSPRAATTEKSARLQLPILPTTDADLIEELRWAAYLERNEFTERTKTRFITDRAKAAGKAHGGYVAAYHAALASKR
jgi:hypothetical protein